MNGIHPELLKQLKEYYKSGTRIRLVRMNDPYTHIPVGTIRVFVKKNFFITGNISRFDML